MKKIMFMFAAVIMAVSAQAAVAMTWQTGTGVKDVDGNAFTTATTGYTAAMLFFTDEACENAVSGVTGNTATSYKTKGSAGFSNITSASFDAGTYYAKLTITEDATGKTYTSEVATFTIPEGASAGVTMNYTSGLNIGGSSKLGDMSYAGGDVPEPTSGILLLVGGMMLALRRKQK